LVGLAVATGSDLVMVASYLEMLVGRPSPGEAYAAGSDDVAWRDLVGAAGVGNDGDRVEGHRQYQQFGDTIEALLARAGQAMLDAAQLRPGERVLDVGYGFALRRSKRRRGPRRPAGLSASTSPLQCSSPPGSASQPPVWTTSS
jgi:hypothetical protein